MAPRARAAYEHPEDTRVTSMGGHGAYVTDIQEAVVTSHTPQPRYRCLGRAARRAKLPIPRSDRHDSINLGPLNLPGGAAVAGSARAGIKRGPVRPNNRKNQQRLGQQSPLNLVPVSLTANFAASIRSS